MPWTTPHCVSKTPTHFCDNLVHVHGQCFRRVATGAYGGLSVGQLLPPCFSPDVAVVFDRFHSFSLR